MSARHPAGGIFISSHKPLNFKFNGRDLQGFEGDTLASALLGAGQMMVGRSFKYHRPRGFLSAGNEDPNGLLTLGRNSRLEPNARATVTPLSDGLETHSQNHWPSLRYDIGAINDKLSRFLPAGFYYKTFMFPRPFWKHVFEPLIRRSAGLGPAPTAPDADRYEQIHAFCDLLIVGGGVAGLSAAEAAGKAGLRVILLEQHPEFMRRSLIDGDTVDGLPASEWAVAILARLRQMPNVKCRPWTTVSSLYDHGYILAEENLRPTPGDGRPRHRLWRIRAGKVIVAAGATERPLTFAGNDVPGVMLAASVRDYLTGWGVAIGDRTVVVTNNDDAYRTAIALHKAGLSVPVILDARDKAEGALPHEARALGLRVETGKGIAAVRGRQKVTGIGICLQRGEGAVLEDIACDAVAMSGGWSPNVHLWSQPGGKLIWSERHSAFLPDASRPPTGAQGEPNVTVLGAAAGDFALPDILQGVARHFAGTHVEAEIPQAAEDLVEPIWIMPASAPIELRAQMFLDFQNDVKLSDIQLAAREGFASVEHAKRYTTLGMATDQGKTSNVNGLAALSQALSQPISQTGTTTFRPPYTPLTFGSIAGEARHALFQPRRDMQLQAWHQAQGAAFEPVGQWMRPQTYPQAGETHAQATNREILATRNAVSLLDSSTLGKILVKGPDAGRFVDLLYTNVMSSLAVGRCRYGLMCNEQGFVFDDGVVARIAEDTWLCHTTSGGAARVHGWMEDWLQCEWPDFQVYIADITENFGQIAVAGPLAREVLEALGGIDVSPEALPHLGWVSGELGGLPVRIYRISFSGELSFEIATPSRQTAALWQALLRAGQPHGVTPIGTDAIHVLRAEKGFIMVGDETDGSVTPYDLGMDWIVSRKKPDFIGKRGMQRAALTAPDRWKLVGFQPIGSDLLPDGALAVTGAMTPNGQAETQARVTSAYWSPTLQRPIAMGLQRGGMARLGEVLSFDLGQGKIMKARVVDPVVYDKEGKRLDV